MMTFCLTVGSFPVFTTVSRPASPPPPPVDHQAAFRCNCVAKYHASILSGLDHLPAVREVCRLLRLSGHPWNSFDVVAREINFALGRKRGRPSVVRHV